MTPRETLGLYCVHIAQLMTHSHNTVYLAVMLQASWHAVESNYESKVHTSSHDGLQKIYNISLI